tara:strand:+ start:653 stop:1318 length:666 start_codon:yes stop_codon:yes gene_type:complete
LEQKEIKTFERILKLINSDLPKAILETNKLDLKDRDRLNQFLANRTLHTESARYRGRVVEMSIYLEFVLANLLSQYFAKEEKMELLNSIVFDRMDLQRKLNTLKIILKTQHVNIWKAENPNLKKIDKLITFRNNIAHSVLNSSPEYFQKISKMVEQLNKQGKEADFLEEIEFGFFENNKWILKAIKWSEIEDYHKGIYDGISTIENIGKQIIADYEQTAEN